MPSSEEEPDSAAPPQPDPPGQVTWPFCYSPTCKEGVIPTGYWEVREETCSVALGLWASSTFIPPPLPALEQCRGRLSRRGNTWPQACLAKLVQQVAVGLVAQCPAPPPSLSAAPWSGLPTRSSPTASRSCCLPAGHRCSRDRLLSWSLESSEPRPCPHPSWHSQGCL